MGDLLLILIVFGFCFLVFYGFFKSFQAWNVSRKLKKHPTHKNVKKFCKVFMKKSVVSIGHNEYIYLRGLWFSCKQSSQLSKQDKEILSLKNEKTLAKAGMKRRLPVMERTPCIRIK